MAYQSGKKYEGTQMTNWLLFLYFRNNAALLIFLLVFTVLAIVAYWQSLDISLLLLLCAILLFLGIIFSRELIESWRILKSVESIIERTETEEPRGVISDHFVDLETRLSNDSTALEILRQHVIIASILKRSVNTPNTQVLCYRIEIPYFNPLIMSMYWHAATMIHYGIILVAPNNDKMIFNVRSLNLTKHGIHIDQHSFDSVRQLAHNIAEHLNLKIKEIDH